MRFGLFFGALRVVHGKNEHLSGDGGLQVENQGTSFHEILVEGGQKHHPRSEQTLNLIQSQQMTQMEEHKKMLHMQTVCDQYMAALNQPGVADAIRDLAHQFPVYTALCYAAAAIEWNPMVSKNFGPELVEIKSRIDRPPTSLTAT